MLRVKRTHRWAVVAATALLSCGYIVEVTAAITPPQKLGSCKPASPETPADAKDKATKPGNGNKADPSPAGAKTVKSDKTV